MVNLILQCDAAAHPHNLDFQFSVNAMENKAASITVSPDREGQEFNENSNCDSDT